ncbi:MAG: hypothetical protein FJZ86_17100 [Chloroflexi bacterium]|nr:hypothetical protein [Chloroflexota bacterium]
MAKFYNHKWRGTYIEAIPLGYRKYIRFFGYTLPYLSGSKLQFKIKIIKKENESSPRLNELDIWEEYTPYQGDKICRKVETLSRKQNHENAGELKDESYIMGTYVEYWLGIPRGADSHPLVKANLLNDDDITVKFIYPYIFPIIFSSLGFFLRELYNLILRLIKSG